MSATDGVTPLNAANVIHKASDDTTTGSLTYINKNVKLTQAVFQIPFYYEHDNTSGNPHRIEYLYIPVVYPMILLNDPTSHTWASTTEWNMAEPPFIQQHGTVFKKQRGCVVGLHMSSPNSNSFFAADGTILISGF